MNWEVSLIQLVSSKILVAVEEEKRKVTSRKRKSLKKKTQSFIYSQMFYRQRQKEIQQCICWKEPHFSLIKNMLRLAF